MMLDVTVPKTRTTRTTKAKPEPEGRKKSLLSRAGDEAKRAAERTLLLKTLKAHDWNLTHTAAALEMGDASAVLRAIKQLDLVEDYEKQRGWTKQPI